MNFIYRVYINEKDIIYQVKADIFVENLNKHEIICVIYSLVWIRP